ncbi:hypothetical protein CRE_31227 [Caenorhabditis remanei]|uniref:Uncharacterized protein n=1 Tax=Caenorhabditis remanei TaxID=31234 RepID=E3MLP7_CAERE|nr:hypothetical protein CRE_31227 [Caenorhabditis remanei]
MIVPKLPVEKLWTFSGSSQEICNSHPKVADSIASRIPTFTYDPDNKDTIVIDGFILSDDVRTRLVLSKTIIKLDDTFKATASIYQRRQELFRIEYTRSNLEEYTGIVLRRFATS